MLATPFIIALNVSPAFNIFLISLLVVSILQVAYSATIIAISRNVGKYYDIAGLTGHLTHVTPSELTPTPFL
jgi:hypothetical protein